MKEMEIKEAERLVIAKPVASRPTCSKFRSFSELLAGAINASPTNVCSETAITAIRPKTVRFRPVVNCAPVALVSSQAELSGKAVDHSSVRFSKSDIKPAVIYKPQAKLVSKTTASLLANMGNYSTDQQRPVASVDACVQHSKQDKCNVLSHCASKYHQNISSDHTAEPSSLLSSQNLEEDPKALPPAASGDRASYDGYNWRKYGQKQVKGSEYPRSYYKCTHPNCPVKKKVERSFEGKIAEIVYKGEHSHSKPQPPKRTLSGTQGLSAGQDTTTPSRINHPNERNEGSECRAQSQNEIGLSTHSSYQNKAPQSHDPVGTGSVNVGAGTSDNCCGLSGECDKGSKGLEGDDDDEPRSKRRKCENQSNETGVSGEVAGAQEARVVVQSSTDTVETFGDGFRWRKYGQKVVKGNPYPRSYYRCTGLKCNVRKHVERALDDSGVFITTYEGKHNHEMQSRSANPAASEPDSQAPTTENKP